MEDKAGQGPSEGGDVVFLVDEAEVSPAIALLHELKVVLDRHGYAATQVIPHEGTALDLALDPVNVGRAARGRSNVFQRSAAPGAYRWWLARRNPAAAALHEFFFRGTAMSESAVGSLLPADLVSRLVDARALSTQGNLLRSEVLIAPHRGSLYVSDPFRYQNDPEYCYLGRSSFTVPDFIATRELVQPRAGTRLLDLGCGAGVGAVGCARVAEEVVGTDIVERCLRFATVNASLNGVSNSSFFFSDVYDHVEGTFDVILSNTPCEWSWEGLEHARPYEAGGGDFGLELPGRMIAGGLERLRPGGILFAVIMAPVRERQPYAPIALERICVGNPAEVVLYPLFEEYEYSKRQPYRQHRIDKMVRYLAVLQPSTHFSFRFARLDTARLLSSRARSMPPRAAALSNHLFNVPPTAQST